MDFQTTIPSEQLSNWFFAVRWSRMAVQQSIKQQAEYGWSTQYDDEVVSRLESLESYLDEQHQQFMKSLGLPMAEVVNV
jgi:hypothetical protein